MNFKELRLEIPTSSLDQKFIQIKRLIKNSDCIENVNDFNTDVTPTLRRRYAVCLLEYIILFSGFCGHERDGSD